MPRRAPPPPGPPPARRFTRPAHLRAQNEFREPARRRRGQLTRQDCQHVVRRGLYQPQQCDHAALRVVIAGKERPPRSQQRDIVDRKSTRLNSSHSQISYAVFCLKKKNNYTSTPNCPLIAF